MKYFSSFLSKDLKGFTLVEVLVALLIMSILAAMAWQGLDSMVRTKDITDQFLQKTVKLSMAVVQWEADLQASFEVDRYPALSFDGLNLRIIRQSDKGVQVIVWTVREGVWLRWASDFIRMREGFNQNWKTSQALQGRETGWSSMATGVKGWQVICFKGNAWSNCQSTGDVRSDLSAGVASGGSLEAFQEKKPRALKMVLYFGSTEADQALKLTRTVMIDGALR